MVARVRGRDYPCIHTLCDFNCVQRYALGPRVIRAKMTSTAMSSSITTSARTEISI